MTGLVTTDNKNARNIDVNLWAMTNQETGEYGVSSAFIQIVFGMILLTVKNKTQSHTGNTLKHRIMNSVCFYGLTRCSCGSNINTS